MAARVWSTAAVLFSCLSLAAHAQDQPPRIEFQWHALAAFARSRAAVFDTLWEPPVARAATPSPALAQAGAKSVPLQSNLLRFLDSRDVWRQAPDPYSIRVNLWQQRFAAGAASLALDVPPFLLNSPLGEMGAMMHAAELLRLTPQDAGFHQAFGPMRGTVTAANWLGSRDLAIDVATHVLQHNLDEIARRDLSVIRVAGSLPYTTLYSDGYTRSVTQGRFDWEASSSSVDRGWWSPAPGPLDGTITHRLQHTWTQRIQIGGTAWTAGYRPAWGASWMQMPRIDWSRIRSIATSGSSSWRRK